MYICVAGAEPEDCPGHVNCISVRNASLLLSEEPSAATMLSDVKYDISPVNPVKYVPCSKVLVTF